jgi:hypothetical protein
MPSSPTATITSPTGQPENHADLSELVPLRELLKEIPGALRGTPLTMTSARRWVKAGVRAQDGTQIRLKAVKAPRCWLSSRADLIAFLEAQTADRIASHTPPDRRKKSPASV